MKAIVLLTLAILLTGCEDKAKPDYDRCTKLQANGDIENAITACTSSVQADPNSESGKAATKTVAALKDRLAKKQAEEARIAAAQKAAQDAEDAKCHRWTVTCSEASGFEPRSTQLPTKGACEEFAAGQKVRLQGFDGRPGRCNSCRCDE